jgi:hypothetical protein
LSVNHQSVVNWINSFHEQLRARKLALPSLDTSTLFFAATQ